MLKKILFTFMWLEDFFSLPNKMSPQISGEIFNICIINKKDNTVQFL